MLFSTESPIIFLFIQVLVLAIALYITIRLFKLSGIKSLWISAASATIVCLIIFFTTGGTLEEFILSFMPLLGSALVMAIRAVEGLFGKMEGDGGVNSAERQRTLELVEQGKITAEDGAELLEALGRSNAMLGQDKFSLLDILVLAGVALTVLGFFLPWAYIGKGMFQSGQHVGAEGWAVLIIAVLSAVPVFVTPKEMLYKISLLQIFFLLLASALVISPLFRIGSNMGAGLPVCMAGLLLASIACFAKFKKLTA